MAEFVLTALPPFRLDLTVWTLRRRPDNHTDRWDGRTYRRVLVASADPTPVEVEVAQRQHRPAEDPALQVTYPGPVHHPGLERDLRTQLGRLLGLQVDLAAFYRLAEADPILGPRALPFRGMKPPRFPSVFEALANAIACQQLSLNFGILLLNRLAERYGRTSRDSGSPAFPVPEDLARASPAELRPLGFSQQKTRSLIELAGAVARGRLDLEALADVSDEEAVARLRELRGIGRWSAEYALLRGLGRLDVFPGDDVGARNRLEQWLGLQEKLDYEGVQRAVERWRPYRGLVCFHLLLDSLAEREVIPQAK